MRKLLVLLIVFLTCTYAHALPPRALEDALKRVHRVLQSIRTVQSSEDSEKARDAFALLSDLSPDIEAAAEIFGDSTPDDEMLGRMRFILLNREREILALIQAHEQHETLKNRLDATHFNYLTKVQSLINIIDTLLTQIEQPVEYLSPAEHMIELTQYLSEFLEIPYEYINDENYKMYARRAKVHLRQRIAEITAPFVNDCGSQFK
jgi:hypothetical protein